MIGKLRGRLDGLHEGWALIDTGGIGWRVHASSLTLAVLGRVGDEVRVWIEPRMREDGVTLYAFAARREQALFRLLVGVSGVGGRLALAALSSLGVDRLSAALAAGGAATLQSVPGVGAKLARRLCGELAASRALAALRDEAAPASASGEDSFFEEAVSALVNLGYGRMASQRAVQDVRPGHETEAEEGKDSTLAVVIAQALRRLSAGAAP